MSEYGIQSPLVAYSQYDNIPPQVRGDLIIFITGVLCGECEGGYGVSALLSNCVTCSDAYSLLIVILGESVSTLTTALQAI